MWQLKGQDRTLAQLEKSLREGRYAHSYLLIGPPHVGKLTLAINMAQALNCLSPEPAPCGHCTQCGHIAEARHPDVVLLGADGRRTDGQPKRDIGINDVREIHRQASLKPFEGSHRVFLLDRAEHMSEEASNALLKTLEEPPPQVVIILLTSDEEALLPTIRSRCRIVELRPMPLVDITRELAESHSLGEEEAEKLARLSMGCLGWALSALSDPSIMETREAKLEQILRLSTASLEDRFSYASELASLFYRNRQEAGEELNMWLQWWRDLLLLKEGAEEFIYNVDRVGSLREQANRYSTAQVAVFIRAVLKTLDALEQNANSQLALEVLMLSLPRERVTA